MSVLCDRQIAQLLSANPPLANHVPGNDFTGPRSPVQAASLDLTVGDIFTPGVADDAPGGASSPRSKLSLKEGATAVVRTLETLAVPADLVAIAFPPASLSIQGVLMTNPGQIDPGYRGKLHLTVINMGREPLSLLRGERIIRVIFLRLARTPDASYAQRHPGIAGSPISGELLATLSPDFVEVEKRAKAITDDAVLRAGWRSAGFAAVATLAVTLISTAVSQTFDKSSALQDKIDVINATLAVDSLKSRISDLESQLKRLAPAAQGGVTPAATPGK